MAIRFAVYNSALHQAKNRKTVCETAGSIQGKKIHKTAGDDCNNC